MPSFGKNGLVMKACRRPLPFCADGALHVRRAVVAVVHAAALEVRALVPGEDGGQIGLVVRADDNLRDHMFRFGHEGWSAREEEVK